MKNNVFTPIELLVVIVILASIVGLIFGGIRAIATDEYIPEEAQEYVEEPQESNEVRELRIQNELLKKLVQQKAEQP